MSNRISPITLLKFFATFKFPFPWVRNLLWSSRRDSRDLNGYGDLLLGDSASFELGIVHHRQLCRPTHKSKLNICLHIIDHIAHTTSTSKPIQFAQVLIVP